MFTQFRGAGRATVSSGAARPSCDLQACCLGAVLLLAAATICGCASPAFSPGGGGNRSGTDDNRPDNANASVAREIEEADIVKLENGFFYLANRYRGLRIIDARTIERPRMAGGLDLRGRGVELFVDGDRAFVLTSADFFNCGTTPVSFNDSDLADSVLRPDFAGSRITVVDVSDRDNPVEIAHFDLDGFVTATRRVGDVIYAAGNATGSATPLPGDGGGDGTPSPGGGGPAPMPPSSTGDAATVDENGQGVASATSPAGVTGRVSLSGAAAGAFVQVRVSDGNTQAMDSGIREPMLPAAITPITNLTTGAFTAVVSFTFNPAVLSDVDLDPSLASIYRFVSELGVWIAPETVSTGLGQPTDRVGETGYLIDADESVVVWEVVDELGDFAVGGPLPIDVTIEIAPSVGGAVTSQPDIGPSGAALRYGDVVTLTARADSGYRFARWLNPPATATFPTPQSMRVVLTDDAVITPVFEPVATGGAGARVFVASINIADAANIELVDRVEVTGRSLDIHVTSTAIYVLGDDPTMADTTRVTYVDIADPAGDIAVRDTFRVPGTIDNRFFADVYRGVFRIVTEDVTPPALGVGRLITLYDYDIANPDDVQRVGQLSIQAGGALRAVRFDGRRGYVVTRDVFDPLYVLDLSDPADPVVAGRIQVFGFATFLVPMEDRLLAVGFFNRNGVRPALWLYDVTDPRRPDLLSRVVLGQKWTFSATSEATVDEQALKVIEDQQLILMPFSNFDERRARFVDSLQLVDLLPRTLRERGLVEHRGLVRRAGVTDTRLWVLSDEAFQVADIDDRDRALPMGNVDVVTDQDLLDAGLFDCVDSARLRGRVLGVLGDDVIFFPGGGFCGAVGFIQFGAIALGLGALGLVSRRWRGMH